MPECKEAIQPSWCIVRVLPMMLVWVVGEGGRAMRSSISEMEVRGTHRQDEEEVPSAIDTPHIPFLEVPRAGGGPVALLLTPANELACATMESLGQWTENADGCLQVHQQTLGCVNG